MKKKLIAEIIAYLFVILFLYTGVSKLADYSIFKEQIATSPVLDPISNVLAIALPLIEIIISGLLLVPVFRYTGLWLSLILMLLFTGYIFYILNFNDHLPCSCGGVIAAMSWKQHIIFNITFIVLSVAGIISDKQIENKIVSNTKNYQHT